MPGDTSAWRHLGACVNEDPDLFFPDEHQRRPDFVPALADQICHSCPVIETCRDHGIRHELLGIWGGTSPAWRERVRRTAGIPLETPQFRTRGVSDWVTHLNEPDEPEDDEEEEVPARWAW